MRYWKLKESNRVIATSCQMSTRWIEISEEEFYIQRDINARKIIDLIEKSLEENKEVYKKLA